MKNWIHKIDLSAVWTIVGIILLFSTSIAITLIVPGWIDKSWVEPSSIYQKQMYEISDPNVYISSSSKKGSDLQVVQHLKAGYTLSAFKESKTVKIIAPSDLKHYITKENDPILKLTSRLLLLRPPEASATFDAPKEAAAYAKALKSEWKESTPAPDFLFLELYAPEKEEAFVQSNSDGVFESWIDESFTLVEGEESVPYYTKEGTIYAHNPVEWRFSRYTFGSEKGWRPDPQGKVVSSVQELKDHELGFLSRQELIRTGENIFKIEGCWYCHTDQTRTLVQDVVLNGSAAYPSPPSTANEYIYQETTFPGTKRNGPDLSRTGIKRPDRDWHKSHFWSPQSESPGSIMPSFQHFFDFDPRGTSPRTVGVPNYKFEAIFQYLMTKGTRITAPTKGWWLGKDPVDTKALIEGKK
jgi:cytochrome c oxidase cbb3-type subunit 2